MMHGKAKLKMAEEVAIKSWGTKAFDPVGRINGPEHTAPCTELLQRTPLRSHVGKAAIYLEFSGAGKFRMLLYRG